MKPGCVPAPRSVTLAGCAAAGCFRAGSHQRPPGTILIHAGHRGFNTCLHLSCSGEREVKRKLPFLPSSGLLQEKETSALSATGLAAAWAVGARCPGRGAGDVHFPQRLSYMGKALLSQNTILIFFQPSRAWDYTVKRRAQADCGYFPTQPALLPFESFASCVGLPSSPLPAVGVGLQVPGCCSRQSWSGVALTLAMGMVGCRGWPSLCELQWVRSCTRGVGLCHLSSRARLPPTQPGAAALALAASIPGEEKLPSVVVRWQRAPGVGIRD